MKIRERFLGKAVCADRVCRPCAREGGTRSVPEGLLVQIYNNPSVSRAETAPFAVRAGKAHRNRRLLPRLRRQLPSLCKGRWRTERVGRAVGCKNTLFKQTKPPDDTSGGFLFCFELFAEIGFFHLFIAHQIRRVAGQRNRAGLKHIRAIGD